MTQKLICHYCGAEKDEPTFFIGACSKEEKDWCMIEGTGYMSCPNCYDKASKEGQDRIDQHIKEINNAQR